MGQQGGDPSYATFQGDFPNPPLLKARRAEKTGSRNERGSFAALTKHGFLPGQSIPLDGLPESDVAQKLRKIGERHSEIYRSALAGVQIKVREKASKAPQNALA